MIITTEQQEARKAARKKQEERARGAVAARKRAREEELKRLHVLANEIAALMGGKARAAAASDSWMFVDLSENHELSFYREGDQIDIRGRANGVHYALKVSPRLAPADVVKAINRKFPA